MAQTMRLDERGSQEVKVTPHVFYHCQDIQIQYKLYSGNATR
jgi:hypothetical protein